MQYPKASENVREISLFWIYCQSLRKTIVQKLIHVSSNVFCTFNLTFFTSKTLREGVVDSFLKQETPVPSFTSPADPDSS